MHVMFAVLNGVCLYRFVEHREKGERAELFCLLNALFLYAYFVQTKYHCFPKIWATMPLDPQFSAAGNRLAISIYIPSLVNRTSFSHR